MVDEKKVILMTKLASYEEGEGKKYVTIAKYFRGDYISSQLLKSLIAGTLAFIAVLGVFAFYNMEFFMEDIYNADLVGFARKIGLIYIVCIGIYLVISYILAVYRYNKARESLKSYYVNLRKLYKYYE